MNPADEVRRWLARDRDLNTQIGQLLDGAPSDETRGRVGSLAAQARTALKRAEVHALAHIGEQLQRIADDLTAIPPHIAVTIPPACALCGQPVSPGDARETDAGVVHAHHPSLASVTRLTGSEPAE